MLIPYWLKTLFHRDRKPIAMPPVSAGEAFTYCGARFICERVYLLHDCGEDYAVLLGACKASDGTIHSREFHPWSWVHIVKESPC